MRPVRVGVVAVREDGTADVRDTLGKEYRVRWDVTRTGLVPATGELWIIDDSLGFWTFAAKMGWDASSGSGGSTPWTSVALPTDGVGGAVTAMADATMYYKQLAPTTVAYRISGQVTVNNSSFTGTWSTTGPFEMAADLAATWELDLVQGLTRVGAADEAILQKMIFSPGTSSFQVGFETLGSVPFLDGSYLWWLSGIVETA